MNVWIGFNWMRIQFSFGLFWRRWWNLPVSCGKGFLSQPNISSSFTKTSCKKKKIKKVVFVTPATDIVVRLCCLEAILRSAAALSENLCSHRHIETP
jgi:hypothetical protein